MTSLGKEYSRHSFENSSDSAALARNLADLLTDRLRRASDVRAEARALVAELRAVGHDLFSWDESTECETWGDDYVRPRTARIIVELHFSEDDRPWARVEFGPWPSPAPAMRCPRCQKAMSATVLRVHVVGHGHATSREVHVEVYLGEQERRTFSAGQGSRGLQVPGLWCSACAGLWLPDTSQIGWTG